MSTASSIKKALRQVGVAYSFDRSGVTISGEFLSYDTSILSSRIFVKEHAIDAMMAHDTLVAPGDILHFSTGTYYLLAHKNPEVLIDSVIYYDASLLKCNFDQGKILRPSGENAWNNNYRKITSFQTIKSDLKGICTEANLTAPTDLNEEEYGNIITGKLHLYYSSGEDIRVFDRIEPKSGEFYRIESIRDWTYPGIVIAELGNDTR